MDKVDDAMQCVQKPWKKLRFYALRSPFLHTSPSLTTAISNEVRLCFALQQKVFLEVRNVKSILGI